MIWQIERSKHKVFARNPLDTVIAQLKFQPILRIGSGKGVPDFQDLIRKSFSGYAEGEIRNVHVGPDTQVSTKVEKVYHFLRESDSCKVQLSSDNVLLEAKDHRSRDELLEDFGVVMGALEQIYSPIDSTRFGVRYINIIRKSEIEKSLDRSVSWDGLINAEYLKMPAKITDLDRTFFANQITSPLSSGEITLRYGITKPSTKDQEPSFTFDIDRYIESTVNLGEIGDILTNFTDDIFSLFNTVPGIDLIEWMSKSRNDDKSMELH